MRLLQMCDRLFWANLPLLVAAALSSAEAKATASLLDDLAPIIFRYSYG